MSPNAAPPIRVVFVAPFFLDTTVRFIRAVAEQPGARVCLISQDPVEKLDGALRSRLFAHHRVADGLHHGQLIEATRALGQKMGGIDRLIGALEQLQVPLGAVRDALRLDGMGEAAARNFREKNRMKDVLRAAGLPVARHRLVSTVADGVDFAREIGGPIVIKPPDGAGGFSTYRAEDAADAQRILNSQRPSADRPLQCEEFVVGVERSFDVMSIRGRPLWHSLTMYDPAPLHVLRNPWIQWTVLLPRETDHPRWNEIRRVGVAALSALGMTTGISHMEWFERPDGSVVVSEIGARPPGARIVNLMGQAHDTDFFARWAEAMVHERFVPPETRFAAGCAYLRGQGEGRVVAVHGLDAAQRELGHLVAEVELPRIGAARASSYEGEGWVILKHPETRVVHEGLRRLISTVRVELG